MNAKFSLNWKSATIHEKDTLRAALAAISHSGRLMACLLSPSGELTGILTDSDIRKAMLNGASLDDSVLKWANKNPITALENTSVDGLLEISKTYFAREIPLVDENNRLTDIFMVSIAERRVLEDDQTLEIAVKPPIDAEMFILAGGLGTRLRPVVADRPKPLALVGNRSLIEILMTRAYAHGVRKFHISVNYMADHVERHLQQEHFSKMQVDFIRENKRLGTAGSLWYLSKQTQSPLLVCNADILTTTPYDKLVVFHEQEKAHITCVVRPYRVSIPFGVVDICGGRIAAVNEKPEFEHFVNAGIYVLSPEALSLIKKNEYLDMPTLIQTALLKDMRVVPFFLHEYWLDVGRPEDYAQANEEFNSNFSDLK